MFGNYWNLARKCSAYTSEILVNFQRAPQKFWENKISENCEKWNSVSVPNTAAVCGGL